MDKSVSGEGLAPKRALIHDNELPAGRPRLPHATLCHLGAPCHLGAQGAVPCRPPTTFGFPSSEEPQLAGHERRKYI